MAGAVFLRLPPGPVQEDADPPLEWLFSDPARAGHRVVRATGAEVAPEVGAARVVLLAPTEEVLLTEAALPGRNRQRLLQALPYALEEQLIDDVDQMHFVLGPSLGEGRYSTAVVHRGRLEQWLSLTQVGGIHLDAVIPDVLALPLAEGAWTVFLEAGRVLVRTGPYGGFAATPDTAPMLLAHALGGAGDAVPGVIRVYDAAGTGGDFLRPAASQPPLETLPYSGGLLGLAAESGAGRTLNLLQGEFSPRAQLSRRLRPWYATAALVAALLILQPAVFAYEHWQASQRSERLRQAIESTYREAFPEAQRIVNPRAQMEARLRELRARAGGTGGGFIDMLAVAGPLLDGEGIHLRSLRYREGQLDVELEAADFQRLEGLKEQLSKAGLSIEIQSATSREDKVDGRLLIRGEG